MKDTLIPKSIILNTTLNHKKNQLAFAVYFSVMNTATDSQAGVAAADSTSATTGGGGDALDKGIDFLGRKTGHQQVCHSFICVLDML